MADSVAVEVTVTGRVQGVSFRAACRRRARELGVAGWVRNEADGTVSGRFEGSRTAVDALVDWCHDGPPGARVRKVIVLTATPIEEPGFRIEL